MISEVDPGEAAERRGHRHRRQGDLFLDNYWSDDFRFGRALLLARATRLLPEGAGDVRARATPPAPDDADDLLDEEIEEPFDDDARRRT